MSGLFQPIAADRLFAWVFRELESRDSVFGIPRRHFFLPRNDERYATTVFGQRIGTPFGPAAGPHTQMAQNIVAAWLCGARYIELKTVQTLDELDVSKPCIDMQDEGYNVEWSQELKVHQSFDEYLRAWVLIHALHHRLGFPGKTPGVVFNLSVGYDLSGIRKPNVQWFLDQAQDALGHRIEVISGIEEARLVHLGVAHSLPDPGGRRLVVDIGGGSTEIIIGEGLVPIRLESLYMGCVSMSERYFADGAIRKANMKDAILAARLELQSSKHLFRRLGWSMATGSSGTIRTIRDVVVERGWSDNGISADSLKKLRVALVESGHADKIDFAAVSEDRKPVFAGGVAVLSAVFHALKIERMLHSTGALREGLLYDLIGRIQHQDMRESSVQAMAQRYHVDLEQAARVEAKAQKLLGKVDDAWQLVASKQAPLLTWAARVYEIGLDIAHSQYHKHGAYLIEHSDLPGFSRQDQQALALLVRGHYADKPEIIAAHSSPVMISVDGSPAISQRR